MKLRYAAGGILLISLLAASIAVHAAPPATAPAATQKSPAISDFNAVPDGTFVVYNIEDLTGGRQEVADQIDQLIRQRCEPNAWEGVWRGAAMRATAWQLTVKTDPNRHQLIRQLLHQLRENRDIYICLEYRLVKADVAPEQKKSSTIANPTGAQSFNIRKELIGSSQITFPNGSQVMLIEAIGTEVPTIIATAAITSDRTAAIVSINAPLGSPTTLPSSLPAKSSPPATQPKPQVVAMALGSTTAVRIASPSGDEWLILKAQLLERHWTPAGTLELMTHDPD